MSDRGIIVNETALHAVCTSGSSDDYVEALAELRKAEATLEWSLARRAPAAVAVEPEPEPITPEEAAKLAKASVEQIYRWSKGVEWASRPSTRCVRIARGPFLRWLATSGGGR
jgi:hypothetical protein